MKQAHGRVQKTFSDHGGRLWPSAAVREQEKDCSSRPERRTFCQSMHPNRDRRRIFGKTNGLFLSLDGKRVENGCGTG
jgi:hypothetical protein